MDIITGGREHAQANSQYFCSAQQFLASPCHPMTIAKRRNNFFLFKHILFPIFSSRVRLIEGYHVKYHTNINFASVLYKYTQIYFQHVIEIRLILLIAHLNILMIICA